jgi:hypothetical protein
MMCGHLTTCVTPQVEREYPSRERVEDRTGPRGSEFVTGASYPVDGVARGDYHVRDQIGRSRGERMTPTKTRIPAAGLNLGHTRPVDWMMDMAELL